MSTSAVPQRGIAYGQHPSWLTVTPGDASALSDARLQLHHAAQLAAAVGISYLAPVPNDSHTALEWLPPLGALASPLVPIASPFRIAIRVADLMLLLVDADGGVLAALALHGRTIGDAADWIRAAARELGADVARFTLRRHWEIAPHPVESGFPFDTRASTRFMELARWFTDADGVLRALQARTERASEVRCWPHHFDVATLITLDRDAHGGPRTIGVGLEPGDEHYDEPYWYVNLYPAPAVAALAAHPVAGGGHWHTTRWIGAVLPGSRLAADGAAQSEQVGAFLSSAIGACRDLLLQAPLTP